LSGGTFCFIAHRELQNSSQVQFLRDIAQADESSIANFQQKIMRVEQKLAPRKSFGIKVTQRKLIFIKN
jgi:hypothetical protein